MKAYKAWSWMKYILAPRLGAGIIVFLIVFLMISFVKSCREIERKGLKSVVIRIWEGEEDEG